MSDQNLIVRTESPVRLASSRWEAAARRPPYPPVWLLQSLEKQPRAALRPRRLMNVGFISDLHSIERRIHGIVRSA